MNVNFSVRTPQGSIAATNTVSERSRIGTVDGEAVLKLPTTFDTSREEDLVLPVSSNEIREDKEEASDAQISKGVSATSNFGDWVKVFGEANANKTNETLLDVETHTVRIHVRPKQLGRKELEFNAAEVGAAGKVDQQAHGTESIRETSGSDHTISEETSTLGELSSYSTAEETDKSTQETNSAFEDAEANDQPASTTVEGSAKTGQVKQNVTAAEEEPEEVTTTPTTEVKFAEAILEKEEIPAIPKGFQKKVSSFSDEGENTKEANEASTAVAEEETATAAAEITALHENTETSITEEAEGTITQSAVVTPIVSQAIKAQKEEEEGEEEEAEEATETQAETKSATTEGLFAETTPAAKEGATTESEEPIVGATTGELEVTSEAQESNLTNQSERAEEAKQATAEASHEALESVTEVSEKETAMNVTEVSAAASEELEPETFSETEVTPNRTIGDEKIQEGTTAESLTVQTSVYRFVEIEVSPNPEALAFTEALPTQTAMEVTAKVGDVNVQEAVEASTEISLSTKESVEQEETGAATSGETKELKSRPEPTKAATLSEEFTEDVEAIMSAVSQEQSSTIQNVEEKEAAENATVIIKAESEAMPKKVLTLAKTKPSKAIKPAGKGVRKTTKQPAIVSEAAASEEEGATGETTIISTILEVSESSTIPVSVEDSSLPEIAELSTVGEQQTTLLTTAPLQEAELQGAAQPKAPSEFGAIEQPTMSPTVLAESHTDEEETTTVEQSTMIHQGSTFTSEDKEEERTTATVTAKKGEAVADESKELDLPKSLAAIDAEPFANTPVSAIPEATTVIAEAEATTSSSEFEETTTGQPTIAENEGNEESTAGAPNKITEETTLFVMTTEGPLATVTTSKVEEKDEGILAVTKHVSGKLRGEEIGQIEGLAEKSQTTASESEYGQMPIEPSGYDVNAPPAIVTADQQKPMPPEQAIGYVGVPPVVPNTGHPFTMDCSVERDEKGILCEDWAKGGLCTTHRPTMFLFCRRTCLCTGPPEDAL
uniref:ShKT domain-containing protein n=1 Tax=Ascaris lumbricoides TaxID=6252 RepID=A0A0M3HRF5_ASCLU